MSSTRCSLPCIRRSLGGAVLLLTVAAAVQAGPINPPAGPVASTLKPLSEIEPRTLINATNTPGDANSVFRITAPGSYYLGANVNGASGKSGIEIFASGVTIDLGGFSLTGVAGSLDGIRTDNSTTHRITIRNGSITAWAGSGINLTQGAFIGASTIIEGIHSFGNSGDGINSGYSSIITGCTCTSNGGIGIVVQDGSTVRGCSVRQSSGDGISVGRGSSVVDSVAQDNGGTGVHAINGANALNCTATGNGTGVSVRPSGAITGCQAANNVSDGIFGGGTVTIQNCSAFTNGGQGIHVQGTATVIGCSCQSNTSDGIRVEAGPINITYGCLISGNNCTLNGANGGDGDGIRVTGNGSRLDGNCCAGNVRGVHVLSTVNILVHNTCSGNTTNWDVVSGNALNVVLGFHGGAISGNSGGTPIGGPSNIDPNANFTY